MRESRGGGGQGVKGRRLEGPRGEGLRGRGVEGKGEYMRDQGVKVSRCQGLKG